MFAFMVNRTAAMNGICISAGLKLIVLYSVLIGLVLSIENGSTSPKKVFDKFISAIEKDSSLEFLRECKCTTVEFNRTLYGQNFVDNDGFRNQKFDNSHAYRKMILAVNESSIYTETIHSLKKASLEVESASTQLDRPSTLHVELYNQDGWKVHSLFLDEL